MRFLHTLRELSAPPSRLGLQLSACAAAMMVTEGTAVTEEEATGEQNPPLPRTVGGARLSPAPYPLQQRCSTSDVHRPRVGPILIGTVRAFSAVCAGGFWIHATVPPLVPSARDPATKQIHWHPPDPRGNQADASHVRAVRHVRLRVPRHSSIRPSRQRPPRHDFRARDGGRSALGSSRGQMRK